MTKFTINMPDTGWITIFRDDGTVEEHETAVNKNIPTSLLNVIMDINAKHLVKFIDENCAGKKHVEGTTCYSVDGLCDQKICTC